MNGFERSLLVHGPSSEPSERVWCAWREVITHTATRSPQLIATVQRMEE